MRTIEFKSPCPSRRGLVGLPNAAIKVAEHNDGRWMWGISFSTSMGGEGFHPLPKWGRFADSEQHAIDAGVAELLERIAGRAWSENPQAQQLRQWAESIVAPVQTDLFGLLAEAA